MCVPAEEALTIRDDVAFFEAVRGSDRQDRRLRPRRRPRRAEMDTAIKQIVSDAMAADGVIDIYAEAGMARPDLSLIDDDFIAQVPQSRRTEPADRDAQTPPQRRDHASRRAATLVTGREFSEMLNEAIRRYQNRTLDAAQVVAELVELAQALQARSRPRRRPGTCRGRAGVLRRRSAPTTPPCSNSATTR